MFEKVNPSHPDKIADRIAGAVVDLCYKKNERPKCACEVLLGHNECNMQIETSEDLTKDEVRALAERIAGDNYKFNIRIVPQDKKLAANQYNLNCGDNGIFRGGVITPEQKILTRMAGDLYRKCPYDGKYLINENTITICQSNINKTELSDWYNRWSSVNGTVPEPYRYKSIINPIGDWTGGTDVDSGATNRKLGSDMGEGITGGGLHGKDLSKGDVSINIYCHILAQEHGTPYEAICNIGDDIIKFREITDDLKEGKKFEEIKFEEVVKTAADFIKEIGGFEKFAEWGLIRPSTIFKK